MSTGSKLAVGLAGGLVALLLGLVLLIGGQASALTTTVGAPVRLKAGVVPSWAAPLLTRAAGRCRLVTAPLLAAQVEVESNWQRGAVSSAGAKGLAQFMPGTWVTYGRDGDGDGDRDSTSPPDALAAQAGYMCHLVSEVSRLGLSGETLDLALAAYNAGLGAVRAHGGIPPYPETRRYVRRVRQLTAKYAAASGQPVAVASQGVRAVIAAGRRWTGTPYAWGGGTVNGPSEGFGRGAGVVGFDCSSLVMYAYYQGTGGRVRLPRTAAAQYQATKDQRVPLSRLRPGDLLFWGSSADSIHHVAMYVGRGRMLNAPHTGAEIQVERVSGGGEDLYAATRVL